MTARLLPGDGVVDYSELVTLLERIGAHPFVATEIFNSKLVGERGSRGAAEAMLVTARSAFV